MCVMGFPTVCVLLSTFNGEKYLNQLLDSVLQQIGVDVHMLVRDDMSSDGTGRIISDYQKRYSNVEILRSDCNFGPANSFMELLYAAGDYDYYAFADQDDVWMPDKLSAAVKALECYPEDTYLLYCSNQTIYSDGAGQRLRYSKEPNHTVTQIICANYISGTTLVFNRRLKEYLCEPVHRPDSEILRIRMHDVWVVFVAQLIGKVLYDPESHILYRVHEENNVGLRNDLARNNFFSRIQHVKLKSGKNRRYRLAEQAMVMKADISSDNLKVVRDFSEYKKSFSGRIRLIRNRQIKRDCDENRLLFVVKALAGWH